MSEAGEWKTWPHIYRDGKHPVIITLHGYGGNEVEVGQLATWLAPGNAVLSPRGPVIEAGTHRWYGAFTGTGFDPVDIHDRAEELISFLRAASEGYGFSLTDAIVAGFSNGAAMATALAFLYPDEIRRVAGFSGVLPFDTPPASDLAGVTVWVSHGDSDPWVSKSEGLRLVEAYQSAGASVHHHTRPGGHGITEDEVSGARDVVLGDTSGLR